MRLEVRALPPERTRGLGRDVVRRTPGVGGSRVPFSERSARVPSSSGLGHHPLKVETRVRTPLGLLYDLDPVFRTRFVRVRSGWMLRGEPRTPLEEGSRANCEGARIVEVLDPLGDGDRQ